VTSKTKAELALLATTLIWGNTFIAMKFVLREATPMLNVAIRFGVAAVFFLVAFRGRLFPLSKANVIKGSILGLFLFLGFASQNIGLQFTTASKSAFITGMMVVFVPILQIIIERRSPKLGNIVGVVIVAAGLWLLTSPEGSEFNIGDALTIVCAVVFAVYIVYLDVISKEMTTEHLTFLQIASTGVYAWIAVAFFEHPVVSFSPLSLLSLVYLTFLATVLTTYVQTRFQKDTTPTRAVVIFSVEPVIASVSAYFVLGEQLGALGVVGGGLIIAGVLISELSDNIPVLSRSLDIA
jgi:drug/metabolite transporter (DMT)-like permease